MVVARRDIGRQRPERIKRRLAAILELLLHVDLDLVHRHVAGAFDHHLAALGPGDLGQFAKRFKFSELGAIVGVGNRARTQTVTKRERHIVSPHDVANVFEPLVEEALLVMRKAPLGHDRAAARDDAGDAIGGQRHEGQPHAGMDREVVDALLACSISVSR